MSGQACPSGKIRYRDKLAAQIALSSTSSKDRGELRIYRCPRCSGWHLTSESKRYSSSRGVV